MKKIIVCCLTLCMCLCFSRLSFAADAKKVAEKGLVAYWSFDEGKGEVVKDKSGNDNEGEIIEAEWVKGKVGNALKFNGSTSYISIAHSDSLIPDVFTIEAWINPESLSGTDRGPMILSKYGGNWHGYMLLIEGSSGCPSMHIDTQDSEIGAGSDTALVEGKWYFIVGTYDGKTAKFYVNGELKESAEAELTQDEGIALTIGKASWCEQAFFTGIIDEVKIYNRVLSEKEIKDQVEVK